MADPRGAILALIETAETEGEDELRALTALAVETHDPVELLGKAVRMLGALACYLAGTSGLTVAEWVADFRRQIIGEQIGGNDG